VGLEYLDSIYHAIREKHVIGIWYQSFKARRAGRIIFYPYLLKEYRNRWFVLGSKKESQVILTLALDRIKEIEVLTAERFRANENFNSEEYFKYVIGVTANHLRPTNIHLLVHNTMAPYVLTKPLHHTQQFIARNESGIEIAIKVIPNFELEREILGFGENMKVLAPESLKNRINERMLKAVRNYSL